MDKERIQVNKAKSIIQIVQDGKNTEYWKILNEFILDQIKHEQNYLDGFKSKGLESKDIFNFNRSRDRLVFLINFLKINEKIINENMSIVEKIKKRTESFSNTWKTVSSFLKR